MFVRYWMIREPKFATEKMALDAVLDIMREYSIRRLPVVKDGIVCGIITLVDLYRFMDPRVVKMKSVPDEVRQALTRHAAGDVMLPDPFACDPNVAIEDVGEFMRREKISVLPVIEHKKLVGIITESNVLEALTKIAKQGNEGERICLRISVAEKAGVFNKITESCLMNDLEILTILTHPMGSDAHMVMLRLKGERTNDFVQEMRENKYEVLMVGEKSGTINRVSAFKG
jgi:acetoin utilization protein AcuB